MAEKRLEQWRLTLQRLFDSLERMPSEASASYPPFRWTHEQKWVWNSLQLIAS